MGGGGIDGGTGGLAAVSEGLVTACACEVLVNGTYRVGGLVGYNSGTITNSYSTGSVRCNVSSFGRNFSSVSGTGLYVGGLVGYNSFSGTISNSYSTGSVSGTGWYVGGLVGSNYATIPAQPRFARPQPKAWRTRGLIRPQLLRVARACQA